MKLFYAFSLLALLSSCGPKYKSIQGKIEFIDFPQIGRSSTVNIGDSLLSKAKVETRDGFYLNESVSGTYDYYTQLQFNEGDYYEYSEMNTYRQFMPTNPESIAAKSSLVGDYKWAKLNAGLQINKEDKTIKGWVDDPIFHTLDLDKKASITKKTVTLVNSTNFKQELIYNGKSGNIARFLYREYSGTLARPAFSQEVTYDLSESTTIGFKKVRIEVLGTTNTSITYKVISGFEM
jgi:hypothetical protein